MANVNKYVNAFSGSLIPDLYVLNQGSSSWIPITTSVREPDANAMVEIIDEALYEILPASLSGAISNSDWVDFSYTNNVGPVPLTVTFMDASTGSIVEWFWEFGDGITSFDKNTTHTYNTSSSGYTVKLTVTDLDNNVGFEEKVNLVQFGTILASATFSADPRIGDAPLSVVFNNESQGSVSTYKWHFGDGQTSTQFNPIHTYQYAGDYTVQLDVSGSDGVNRNAIYEDYILANAIPVPIINTIPGGYLHVHKNSEMIYDHTGSFTVELLFKLECLPEYTPDDFAMLFDADQVGGYSSNFPWEIDPLPFGELGSQYSYLLSGSSTTSYRFDYDAFFNYPINWWSSRGFIVDLLKSSGRFEFRTNVKEYFSGSSDLHEPWKTLVSWSNMGDINFEYKSTDPNAPKISGIKIPINETMFSTGSFGDFAFWQDFPLIEWFNKNINWGYSGDNELKAFRSITNNLVPQIGHWYHIIAGYKQPTPNFSAELNLFVKDVTDNISLATSSTLESGVKLQKVYPTVGVYNNWQAGPTGFATSPLFGQYPWTVPEINWPNYPIYGPRNSTTIRFSGINTQAYGKLKYIRYWTDLVNHEYLASHSLHYTMEELNNDPKLVDIGIEKLIMFTNLDENQGGVLYDKSGHAMDCRIVTGSDSEEIPIWAMEIIQ